MRSLLMLLLLTTSAYAADFSKVFLNDDGKPLCSVEIKDNADCPEGKALTLRMASRNALRANFPDERDISGDEKYRREELGQGLVGAGDIKLKAEDIALLKKLIAKLYNPVVVYQAWNILDPKEAK